MRSPNFFKITPTLRRNIRVSADRSKRSGKRVVGNRLMSVLIYREPVPKRGLPSADESVVVANGAVPVNALQFIGAGIRHDDAGAKAPSRTSATTCRSMPCFARSISSSRFRRSLTPMCASTLPVGMRTYLRRLRRIACTIRLVSTKPAATTPTC
jgi:hypothetical protein